MRPLDCHRHGTCIRAYTRTNERVSLCRCESGWIGDHCQFAEESSNPCSCASDALCISSYPVSICLCPLDRGGPRCIIKVDPWQSSNTCAKDGQYLFEDERRRWSDTKCLCSAGYHGVLCELVSNEIHVSFDHTIRIPSFIFLHTLQSVDPYMPSKRMTLFKTILPYEKSVILHTSVSRISFMFIQVQHNNYRTPFKTENNIMTIISVSAENRCLSINESFNSSFAQLHLIRRIKHDDSLCDHKKQAVCTWFDHNMTYICQGDSGNCENGGECFEDDPECPSTSNCRCPDCFYGSTCQFSTKGFSLLLDNILGYQIRPSPSLGNQLDVVKFSFILVIVMFCINILNGILSMIVFAGKQTRTVGSGCYFLTISLVSILTIILFTAKFIFLLLAQMTVITNKSLLWIQCVSIDFFLRTCLNYGDWLNAFVAIERIMIVTQGLRFNVKRSQRIAKWTIPLLFLTITATNIHDPISRGLITNDDERRTWCIVRYSIFIQTYNSVSQILHISLPFTINLLSPLVIIINIVRRRSRAQKKKAMKKHISEQFDAHKHLLISPIVLVLLAIPRLIISVISSCMKSDREPWLPLIGYFISFVPSSLVFVVFVLPSKAHRKECLRMLHYIHRRIR